MAEFTSVNADGGDDIFENLAHRSKTTMKLSPSVKEEEAADKAIKTEDGVEDTRPAAKTPSTTPRKRGRKKAGEDAGADAQNTPSKKSKTPNASGETPKKAAMTPIPTSYENASPEDKMLLHMKDVEGKGWAEIKAAWEAMTGTKVGGSTLSGRYSRMKANFVVFKDGDEANILQAKKEIEEKFELEKWHKIAEAVEAKSGNKYPPTAIQKKFKELSRKMNAGKGAGNTAKNETDCGSLRLGDVRTFAP